MQNIIEQISATNKANLLALEGFTTQAFAGVEKLLALNLVASKAMLSESFNHAKATLGAKDAQELIVLQASLVKPLADKSAAYAQHVQAIVTDSSAELTKALEAKTAQAQKAFGDVVENLAQNAPAGTETAVAAFKSALTAGQSAVESAQASAKKAVEVAQTNFTAATKQAADAVKKVAKTA
ncbi:phasin family protein [Rhodoferax sp.]|uniref:phasin family protein n=1 Tax=Rhodoferax sp. TaxID=50421 RepID=UPI00374DD8ED